MPSRYSDKILRPTRPRRRAQANLLSCMRAKGGGRLQRCTCTRRPTYRSYASCLTTASIRAWVGVSGERRTDATIAATGGAATLDSAASQRTLTVGRGRRDERARSLPAYRRPRNSNRIFVPGSEPGPGAFRPSSWAWASAIPQINDDSARAALVGPTNPKKTKATAFYRILRPISHFKNGISRTLRELITNRPASLRGK